MPNRRSRATRALLLISLLVSACGHADVVRRDPSAYARNAERGPEPSHGVAFGDVTSSSVVVWSRTDRPATMHVRLARESTFVERTARVDATHDFAATIAFDALEPRSRYDAEVWFEDGDDDGRSGRTVASGSFQTAPRDDDAAPARFAFGGDVAGQNVCRDVHDGFPIFRELASSELDFFVALGDMVYADSACRRLGRYGNAQIPGPSADAQSLPDYWSRWRYAREDRGTASLLARTPLYAIWDDHEIENDFDPRTDARGRSPRLPSARQAFFDWNPVRVDAEHPYRLHRSIRWGQNLELFVIDTRQYRDPDARSDSTDAGKTMLGDEQREWLERSLAASDATWKFVVSSVTIAVPSGGIRRPDGWANDGTRRGFEHELRGILASARDAGVTGLVFLSADVHFGAVFRHRPFPADAWFEVHELVAGPLHARSFPVLDYDRSFGSERLFYYGPNPDERIDTYEEAKAWMNFGFIEIAADGNLSYGFRNAYGEVVYRATLDRNVAFDASSGEGAADRAR